MRAFQRPIIYCILLFLTAISCTSPRYYYKQGYYDVAIQKAVRKLKNKPNKEKHINYLHKSYIIANSKDNERIQFLRSSGQPDIWNELFEIYTRLKNRQEAVRYLPTHILTRMNFQPINYDNEIHSAKRNAAEYFYASGQKLLSERNRISAQKAYYEFLKVRSYFPNYKDVNKLLIEAEQQGTTHILFLVENHTNMVIPYEFESDLLQLPLFDLNQLFRRFHNHARQEADYHYTISLSLRHINVSPEHVKEIHYSEKKEIEDGFQYVLDKNGNVMKDSLGNDIKIPKFATLVCDIIENEQFKSVQIGGMLTIRNAMNSILIYEPIGAEWNFANTFIVYKGDIRAMTDKTKKKLNNKPLPFPSSEFMILQTADIIKSNSKEFIRRNRHLFI